MDAYAKAMTMLVEKNESLQARIAELEAAPVQTVKQEQEPVCHDGGKCGVGGYCDNCHQQEPDAWYCCHQGHDPFTVWYKDDAAEEEKSGATVMPFFLHPPADAQQQEPLFTREHFIHEQNRSMELDSRVMELEAQLSAIRQAVENARVWNNSEENEIIGGWHHYTEMEESTWQAILDTVNDALITGAEKFVHFQPLEHLDMEIKSDGNVSCILDAPVCKESLPPVDSEPAQPWTQEQIDEWAKNQRPAPKELQAEIDAAAQQPICDKPETSNCISTAPCAFCPHK